MMGDGKWVYSMSSMFRVISIVSIVSMFSIISNCRIRILELSIWHLVLGIEYWVFSGEAAPDAKCSVLHAPVPPSSSSGASPSSVVKKNKTLIHKEVKEGNGGLTA